MELVAPWRQMIAEVTREAGRDTNQAHRLLEQRADFYSLLSHINLDVQQLPRLVAVATQNQRTLINPTLGYFLEEVDRIEKDWKLV
jgi:hypothetical protein